MKIAATITLLSLLTATKALSGPCERCGPDDDNMENALFFSSPLDIEVDCEGINFDALSAKALVFSANALKASFNQVHTQLDGKMLSHVKSTAPFLKDGKSGLRGPCERCGPDDDLMDTSLSFSATVDGVFGLEGCANKVCCFCDKHDESDYLGDIAEIELKAWESKLATIMAMSPYGALQKVDQCKINMTTKAAGTAGNKVE